MAHNVLGLLTVIIVIIAVSLLHPTGAQSLSEDDSAGSPPVLTQRERQVLMEERRRRTKISASARLQSLKESRNAATFNHTTEEVKAYNQKLINQRGRLGLKQGMIQIKPKFRKSGVTKAFHFSPRRPHLLFSSCGDYSRIPLWAGQSLERSFDIIAGYYGDKEELDPRFDTMVDFKYKFKHYKIPSLKYLSEELLPGLLDHYDAVFALDNDIMINTAMIDDLFATRKEYQLTIISPSQYKFGKVSYDGLLPDYEHRAMLKYIHFAETNSPLFEAGFIKRLMATFDEDEQPWDWGLDFLWSSQAWKEGGDVAVANWITMMNPMDSGEIGDSEHQKLNRAQWETFREKYNGSRYYIREKDDLFREYNDRQPVDRNITALADRDYYWFMGHYFDHRIIMKKYRLEENKVHHVRFGPRFRPPIIIRRTTEHKFMSRSEFLAKKEDERRAQALADDMRAKKAMPKASHVVTTKDSEGHLKQTALSAEEFARQQQWQQ